NNFRLKGLAPWLAALAKLKDMAWVRAVIVGNGDTQPWLKMVSELGISERITFAGPTNDIAAYYQAADMLVHPTYYDPCSRVVLEAQSIGLPCVTTKFDGAAEVIEDGVNGYVVKSPDDIGAIASAVRKIAEGKLLPTADRSTPSTVSGFTMRKHAEHVVKLYEKLLNMRRD
ncbi:MAG: glycosyltransferase, partial [Planctomycetes bacterium]|nr:glycosyltransferase [Planctomycetota bacterium]